MSKFTDFWPISFPGLSLQKSLMLKIEETQGYDCWIEPIMAELIYEKPMFELDFTDSLQFDKSAFLPPNT